MTNSSQVIGDLGEQVFLQEMTRLGQTISRLEPDRTGKDFIIEHFIDEGFVPALDLRKNLQVTNVQIKSTMNTGRIPIKLSALKWLVFSNEPSFILVVEFDSALNVCGWRVREVDADIIARSLKAYRKITVDGASAPESKTKITLSLSTFEVIEPNGAAFFQFVQSRVGGAIDEYRKARRQARERSGYDGHPATGKVTFELENHDQFAEALLGLRSLKLVHFKLNDNRFGISVPSFDSQNIEYKEGSFKINPQPSGELLLQALHPTQKPAELRLNVYAAKRLDKNNDIAFKAWNDVITISALSLGGDNEQFTQNFNISLDAISDAYTLNSLIGIFRNSGDGSGAIRFIDPDSGKVYLSASNLNADKQMLDWVFGEAQLFVQLVELGVISRDLKINLRDVINMDNKEAQFIVAFLKAGVNSASFELQYVGEADHNDFIGVNRIVLARSLSIGSNVIAYAVNLEGRLDSEGETISFIPTGSELLAAEVLAEPFEAANEVFVSKVWQAKDRLVFTWPVAVAGPTPQTPD